MREVQRVLVDFVIKTEAKAMVFDLNLLLIKRASLLFIIKRAWSFEKAHSADKMGGHAAAPL